MECKRGAMLVEPMDLWLPAIENGPGSLRIRKTEGTKGQSALHSDPHTARQVERFGLACLRG
jgi:hypothetical protein